MTRALLRRRLAPAMVALVVASLVVALPTEVDDLYALQKGLMELRFSGRGIDWAVRGSPSLARLHVRLVEAIIDFHEAEGEPRRAAEWREWRRYDTRILEHAAIRSYLEKRWPELRTEAMKREAVLTQMLPFEFSDQDVIDLVARLDSVAPDSA